MGQRPKDEGARSLSTSNDARGFGCLLLCTVHQGTGMDNTRNPTFAHRSKKRTSRSRVSWLFSVLFCIWTKAVALNLLGLEIWDMKPRRLWAVSTYAQTYILSEYIQANFFPAFIAILTCLGRSFKVLMYLCLIHTYISSKPSRVLFGVGLRITETGNDSILRCTMTRPTPLNLSDFHYVVSCHLIHNAKQTGCMVKFSHNPFCSKLTRYLSDILKK